VINIVGGVLVVYACGAAALAIRIGFVPARSPATSLYLPGDGLKAVVAWIVIKQVHRAYPGLIDSAAPVSQGPPTRRASQPQRPPTPRYPLSPRLARTRMWTAPGRPTGRASSANSATNAPDNWGRTRCVKSAL